MRTHKENQISAESIINDETVAPSKEKNFLTEQEYAGAQKKLVLEECEELNDYESSAVSDN